MECRDVRPFLDRLHTLPELERQRLAAHLDACAACRDEVAEPFVAASTVAALPLAMPPPHFLEAVLLRIPEMSPLEIAARQEQTRRIYHSVTQFVLGLVTALAFYGIVTLQLPLVPATESIQGLALPFVLVAKALLIVVGQVWLSALLLAVGLAVAALLPRLTRGAIPRPLAFPRPALAGGAALALLLLANSLMSSGDVGTFTAPITTAGPVSGDVTSIAGDITVQGDVIGDVVALAGRVRLADGAHIHGSVMSGGGPVNGARNQIDQAVLDDLRLGAALAQVTGADSPAGMGVSGAALVAGMLAALVVLVLAALVVVLWPHGAVEGSIYLMRFPGRALAVGSIATLGLIVLALGGAVLLASTVVGVVIMPILLLLLHLPYVVGIATVGQALGIRLAGQPAVASAIWGVAAQLLIVVAAALFAPAAALIVFYALGAAGLGGLLLAPRPGLRDAI